MFADHFDDNYNDLVMLYDLQRRERAPAVRLHHLDPTEELFDLFLLFQLNKSRKILFPSVSDYLIW